MKMAEYSVEDLQDIWNLTGHVVRHELRQIEMCKTIDKRVKVIRGSKLRMYLKIPEGMRLVKVVRKSYLGKRSREVEYLLESED